MAEPKTKPTGVDPRYFIATAAPEKLRDDAVALMDLMRDVTGEPPVMWGDAIIGFGQYTYTNASKKPQVWPLVAFSPRKSDLTLYVMAGVPELKDLLSRLGKHKVSGSCLHVKALNDIDLTVLAEIVRLAFAEMRARHC